jgi:DNA helicase II / ATP-dependent DNA helicase PcrA
MSAASSAVDAIPSYLRSLNSAQRAAVEYGVADGAIPGPLLIIAGAGTGKTNTLAHRVAHLALNGARPDRILLLTFSRRAAAEMTRRAGRILGEASAAGRKGARASAGEIGWAGTFHGVANRLLRLHADAIGLNPAFTVLDRSDAADVMNLVRSELDIAKKPSRFPTKDTCLAIYSHVVNAGGGLDETLATPFPWCADEADDLKALFRGYVAAKQRDNVLDYDDLLLYWSHMMAEPRLAAEVGARFDHVLVDEYQDTNALQASILLRLNPNGAGMTVVGDDAQSIYAFRAARVRNILDFPKCFLPPAAVVTLEQNYRSTQPILDATNAVIGLAAEGFSKRLFSAKPSEEKPQLITAADEAAQAEYVALRVLEHREAGIELKRQAVLFRASHHSALLEVELARRNIPFVKYGGLRFLEAAHVKDMLCTLRLCENPRDSAAGFRVLQLLPGIGPTSARAALVHLAEQAHKLATLESFRSPPAARPHWSDFCKLASRLAEPAMPWSGQIEVVRRWYEPHLERLYDDSAVRTGDLEKLEQIAAVYATRERFLSELTLDPPDASGADAGAPTLDEDYLVLSTIHSAKGQEWEAVFVLNVVDGCIPSDMSAGSADQLEEERRLFYVAMTRAKQHLHLVQPLRFFRTQQHRHGDGHVLAPRTRFIPDHLLELFERSAWPQGASVEAPIPGAARVDVAARLRDMWQ